MGSAGGSAAPLHGHELPPGRESARPLPPLYVGLRPSTPPPLPRERWVTLADWKIILDFYLIVTIIKYINRLHRWTRSKP